MPYSVFVELLPKLLELEPKAAWNALLKEWDEWPDADRKQKADAANKS